MDNKEMAGQHLVSKTQVSSSAPWAGKLAAVGSAVGKGLAIVGGIREAVPIVTGIARAAGYTLPFLM